MLRASFAGGLWALLLSTSGLSVASVMTEIPDRSDWAPQFAVTAPDAAPRENAAPNEEIVITTVVVAPSAPDVPASPNFEETAPSVMADIDLPLTVAPTSKAPSWGSTFMQDHKAAVASNAIAAPTLPAAPVLVTLPAPAPVATPAQPVVMATQQAPERPQINSLIVRVQADTTGGGALVQRRLPQILPDEPEEPDADTAAEAQSDAAEESGIEIGNGGGTITDTDEPVTEETVDGAEAVVDAPPETALEAFAAEFENPNNLPLVGVVLVDDGTLEDGPLRVFESGFTSTIAIDALREDASLWSEAYREAGMEIAMQVPLPVGVQPSDVEVAYAAAMDILPEAAFLFTSGDGVLRNDRRAAAQVMSILATDGHGFVTQERGLGSLVREADRASVPVAQIWRELDGNGESVGTMTRTLDRAAFTARQSGSVVVVGRLQPVTLEVLSVWALNAEREGVLLAPVSAILNPSSGAEGAEGDAGATGSGLPQITE